MTLKVFPSIREVLKRIEDEKPSNPFLITTDIEMYDWVDYGDDDGLRIMPSISSSFFSQYLFRGQTARYIPCLPTLHRPIAKFIKDEIDIPLELQYHSLIYQIKCKELEHSIESHPFVKYSRKMGLRVSKKAIAQHYGIPTDLLDLTEDPKVAAFFATCTQNSENEWIPVQKGIGVIYRLNRLTLSRIPGESNKLELIGQQALPRPGEQKAWSLQINPQLDFEKLPINIFLFNQNEKLSLEILNLFDNGKKLFPNDIAFNLAQEILMSRFISRPIARKVILSQGCNSTDTESKLDQYYKIFLEQFDIEIVDKEPPMLSNDQIKEAQDYLNLDKVKMKFMAGLHFVRDIKK
jgi:hypothetical protein